MSWKSRRVENYQVRQFSGGLIVHSDSAAMARDMAAAGDNRVLWRWTAKSKQYVQVAHFIKGIKQ